MKILITGSSSGIGRSTAVKFLSRGHTVIGLDVKDSTIFDQSYTHYKRDICGNDLPLLSEIEILINNAGIQNSGFNDIDVNLKGSIKVTEKYAFQPNIKSVIFIASASAKTGSEFPEYAASKGGVISYMKNVALRVAKYGATSNSISPGGVFTELNDHIINNPKLWNDVMNETPLKKWATTDEIAEWVYFVSVVNKSMTAQDIVIDNGESSKANFIW